MNLPEHLPSIDAITRGFPIEQVQRLASAPDTGMYATIVLGHYRLLANTIATARQTGDSRGISDVFELLSDSYDRLREKIGETHGTSE